MTMNKVYPAFSTPIYKDYINLNKDILNPVLRNIDFKRINTDDRFHSADYKILDNDLNFLKQLIVEKIKEYSQNYLGLVERHKIVITDSWVMKHTSGDSSEMHWHPNSIISGCLYLQTDPKSGNICFFREKSLFNDVLDFETTESEFNKKEVQVAPTDGMIILFPSTLKHGVNPSRSDIPRFCLAFNTWIEGELDPPFRSKT